MLLFYDVTRGVDVATKHEIYELICGSPRRARAILFYSSDAEELAHLCHRVLVMREGRIAAELEPPGITAEADRLRRGEGHALPPDPASAPRQIAGTRAPAPCVAHALAQNVWPARCSLRDAGRRGRHLLRDLLRRLAARLPGGFELTSTVNNTMPLVLRRGRRRRWSC